MGIFPFSNCSAVYFIKGVDLPIVNIFMGIFKFGVFILQVVAGFCISIMPHATIIPKPGHIICNEIRTQGIKS